VRFGWDPVKARTNVRKHDVTFEEATTVFADPLALIVDDELHPDRAIIVGESARQRVIVAVFVEIDEDEVRIISARRATNQERRRYEGGEEA